MIYESFQTVDPKTPHIKKEIIMQNVSPTEGTKQNSGDLIYMKVNILLPSFVCHPPMLIQHYIYRHYIMHFPWTM
jgi:hypothetical protein